MIIIEVTIKQKMGKGDDQQTIETPITLNADHVSTIVPRLEGGSIVILATKDQYVCKETRLEINRQICTQEFMKKIVFEYESEQAKELKPVEPVANEG